MTIIVQAGGLGTRMGSLTRHKPKALISVFGEPLIIRLMRQYPRALFLIIADYKSDIMESYLRKYAPAKFKMIKARGKGTCSGLPEALKLIPHKNPFAIVWCDLWFDSGFWPKNFKPKSDVAIGLSKSFACRWSFQNGRLKEKRSTKFGIAGVYLLKNKQVLSDLPATGEFCAFLQSRELSLNITAFGLSKTAEVGTFESYQKLTHDRPRSRPFNEVIIKDKRVTKRAKDALGKWLQKKEIHWYKKVAPKALKFVPQILGTHPLVLERRRGRPICDLRMNHSQKRQALNALVNALKTLHISFVPSVRDVASYREALTGKTLKRLQKIKSLIPFGHQKIFLVNGKRVRNFLFSWSLIEREAKKFLPDEFVFIHGDPTFSNSLWDLKTGELSLLDPRGYFGKTDLFGDADYDWAKLYYSFVGRYDAFNRREFVLDVLSPKGLSYELKATGWEHLEKEFFTLTRAQPQKIRFIHALIWLSLTTYVWDDWDSVVLAFARGMELMEDYFSERTV